MASIVGRRIPFRCIAAATARYWYGSMETLTTEAKQGNGDSLYRRLSALGGDGGHAGETLDQWVKEGNRITKHAIMTYVGHLRKFKEYNLAIQLHEWLDKNMNKMSDADRAIHVDLLAKARGITSAEEYFDSLEENAKTKKTYGALLNCYAREKVLHKALNLFEKIKELNFTSTLSYNDMMSMHLKIGRPEKIHLLVKEMEESNISPDMYTYNLLMNGYALSNNMEAVEEVLEKMKMNKIKLDWFTYGNLANIYVKSEFLDKANAALRKLEEMGNLRDREAFHSLIKLYGQTSNLSGVNRAWESLKSVFPRPGNASYLVMLLTLSKLGNVETLEKYFAEWESGCSNYDVRVANVMIESYLKQNMIAEAASLYQNIENRGIKTNLKTCELFTNFHIKHSNVDLALKFLEMGVLKVSPDKKWFPTNDTVKMFLQHLEQKDDPDRAARFCDCMKKIDRLDSTVCNSLLPTNFADKVESTMCH